MDWLIDHLKNLHDRIVFIHEGREVNYADVVATVSEFSTRNSLGPIRLLH